MVLFPEGITNPVVVQWFGSDGRLSNGSGLTIGETLTSPMNVTSRLEFNPFRTVHGGRFSCRATITSQTPPFSIAKSTEVDIVAGGMLHMLIATMIVS